MQRDGEGGLKHVNNGCGLGVRGPPRGDMAGPATSSAREAEQAFSADEVKDWYAARARWNSRRTWRLIHARPSLPVLCASNIRSWSVIVRIVMHLI